MPKKRAHNEVEESLVPSNSDGLQLRFREILGNDSVAAFSRRCKLGESTLRNILNGAKPRTDYLTAIADAAGVTVDWLSTGRLPKMRTEETNINTQRVFNMTRVGKSEDRSENSVTSIDNHLLRQCLSACTLIYGPEFAAISAPIQLDYAVELYNLLRNVALANGSDLTCFKKLESKGLADQLRIFQQLGWVSAFPRKPRTSLDW